MNALLSKRLSKQIGLAVILTTVVLYGWHYYFRLPFLQVHPFEAIPAQSAVLIEFPQLPDLQQTDSTLFAKDIRDIADLYPLQPFLTDIRHLQEVAPQTIGRPVAAALLASGRRQLDWTIITNVTDGEQLVQRLKKTYSDFQITENNFKNHTVYDFKKTNDIDFAVAYYRNLLIYGRYALLVEEAMNQLLEVSDNITHDRDFQRVRRLGDTHSTVNLYVQTNQVANLLEPYIAIDQRQAAADLTQLASWAKIGVKNAVSSSENSPPMLDLSGGFIAAQGNHFFRAFDWNDVVQNEAVQDVLPNNVIVLNWFGIDDFQDFYSDLNQQEEEIFRTYFLDWIGEEFAQIVTEPFGGKDESEQFVMFKIKDNKLAISQLRALEENVGVQTIYDYQMFTITQLVADDLLQPVFGAAMNNIRNPFYTIIEDYVVFGNSRAALEIWIDKYVAGQTLANEVDFLQLAAAMESETSLFSAFRIANMQRSIQAFAKRSLRPKLEASLAPLRKLQYVAFNGRVDGGRVELNGKATVTEQTIKQTRIAWKMPLKYPAASAPVVVKNRATQQYEILIQDTDHNLYLLNRGGGIVWEKHLADSIISTIHAIDFYRNGKTQYLFNTPNQIFLLDQQGENVGAFPLHLQAAATAGVSVVDFDRNQEYNFFVPCDNGYIYGFNKTGRPLAGWNPRRGVGIIEQPLQHFQRNGKDFVVAFNDEQKVLAFKRNGEYRFRSKAFVGQFMNAPHWQVKGSSPRVVLTDTEGNAYITNLFGESFKMHLPVGQNESVDFTFCDVVGDSRNDYIVLSDRNLVTYFYHDSHFSQHFSIELPQSQQQVFPVKLPESFKSHLGVLSTEKKLITLLDGDGNIYPDFPLPGTSAFSVVNLFNNNERVLVVANGANVYAYQLR
ncbi:MAG: DUF3352 domain-containing protein [Saprospiraceae bacterium]